MLKNPELIKIIEFGQPYYYNCLNCDKPLMRPEHRNSGFCSVFCEDQHAVELADEEPVAVEVIG